jgi:alkanesulfonate monooxygenase SsuD/methylene tetrahydromethanopterin reductase-like flavin-dependent oxidoreductase (luciferase family)
MPLSSAPRTSASKVGGAARRAARIGDGFFPAIGDVPRLKGLLDALGDECGKVGRDPASIEISCSCNGSPDVDAVRRYEDLGVSRLVIAPPAFDPEGLRRGLGEFAQKVIAKL